MTKIVKTPITAILLGDEVDPTIANQPHLDLENNIDDINTYLNASNIGYFEHDSSLTTGLNFYYTGGLFFNNGTFYNIAAGSRSLTASTTNYVEIATATGTITHNTTGFTAANLPLWKVVTGTTSITTITDQRTFFKQYWHQQNDGSGSGLDADKLDGVEGASYARSDVSDTISGTFTFTNTQIFNAQMWFEDGDHAITYNDGGGNFNIRVGHRYTSSQNQYTSDGVGAIHVEFAHETTNPSLIFKIGEDPTGKLIGGAVTWAQEFTLKKDGTITWGGNKVWHAGNDGASSGLDADLLDGLQGSSYFVKATDQSQSILFTPSISDITAGNVRDAIEQARYKAADDAIAFSIVFGS